MLLVALAGCSGVPYAPVPSVIPRPSAAASTPAAASPIPVPTSEDDPSGLVHGPEFELRGTLVSDDGQQAQLSAHLQLGDLGSAQRDENGDRGSQRLAVQGAVTLSNATPRINVPAASVLIVLQAGYPSTSPACRALRPPDGMTWGRYCWYLLATADPYGAYHDLVALQPGEHRVRILTTRVDGLGQLRVDETDREETGAALRRPAVVVATTSAVNYDGTRLRAGCGVDGSNVIPGSAAPQAGPVATQNVVAAVTHQIACRDFRYLGP